MWLYRSTFMGAFAIALAVILLPAPGQAEEFRFVATDVTEPGNPTPPTLEATLELDPAAVLRGSASGSDSCDPGDGFPCNGANFVDDGIIDFQAFWGGDLSFPFGNFPTMGISNAIRDFSIVDGNIIGGNIDIIINLGGTTDVEMFGNDGLWSEGFCFVRCSFDGVWTSVSPVREPAPEWPLLIALAGLSFVVRERRRLDT